MSHLSKACLMAGLAITGSASAQSSASDDPYAWLEDVTAVRSMDWVKAHNAKTEAELAGTPEFQATETAIRTPPTGTTSRRSRLTTCSMRSATIRQPSSGPPLAMTACIPRTHAR